MSNYKIEIKWGLIFFTVGLLWMVFEKLLGWHSENIANHATYTTFFAVPAILMVVFALLDKRKNYYNGYMNWKQGFITGLIITVIVAVLSPLSQIITSYIISPEYFPNVIEYSVSSGEMTREEATEYFSLINYIVQSIIGAIVMGTITSAVVALFVMKKPNNEPKVAA